MTAGAAAAAPAAIGVLDDLHIADDPSAAATFDCSVGTGFLAQGFSTQLLAREYGAGSSTYEPIGEPSEWTYNSIAYNAADGLIYGVSRHLDPRETPAGHLLQVDAEGTVTDLGAIEGDVNVNNVVNGVFGADGNLKIVTRSAQAPQLISVDVTASPPVGTVAAELSQRWQPSDVALLDGYLWGMAPGDDGSDIWRVDPESGQVDVFASPVEESQGVGAAWTFGNGDLGFGVNQSGNTYQIGVAGAGTDTPEFSLVAQVEGPAVQGNNDGTACAGPDTVDLSVQKSGPAEVEPGGDIEWTITVTNNGEGTSAGWAVSDIVPEGVTNVASPTEGANVDGNTVTLTGGELAVGEEAELVITGTAPAEPETCVDNTAEVMGQDTDENMDNNSSTVQTCTTTEPEPPEASYTLGLTADPESGTEVEDDQEVAYTVELTNTGDAEVSPTVTSDLSDVLDDAVYNDGSAADAADVEAADLELEDSDLVWTPTVAAGDTVSVTYSVTVKAYAEQGDHLLVNAVTGDGPITGCDETPCASVEHPTVEPDVDEPDPTEEPDPTDDPTTPPGDEDPTTPPDDDDEDLPDTGSGAGLMTTIGLLLAGLGAAGALIARRRRAGGETV